MPRPCADFVFAKARMGAVTLVTDSLTELTVLAAVEFSRVLFLTSALPFRYSWYVSSH